MFFFFWPLIYVSDQNDRETRSLTGRYCEPWQNTERGERVSSVERRWSQYKTVKTLQGVSNAGKYFARRHCERTGARGGKKIKVALWLAQRRRACVQTENVNTTNQEHSIWRFCHYTKQCVIFVQSGFHRWSKYHPEDPMEWFPLLSLL